MNLRIAAPALFLASLLLLPFLNKPFTVDDPLYLREAQHALVDPAHPADFEAVWNEGDRMKLSQFMAGGTLPAYVLAPVAALGAKEWVAHLYQWVLLCAFVLATVAAARRLGCDAMQANTVALLVATSPVTLGMAATCMPDLMAAAFAMIGLERVLAFRVSRSAAAGIVAALFLAAATQCRASTVPLLGVAVLLLWPASMKRAAQSLWPVALALAIGVAAILVTRSGPAGHTLASSLRALTGLRNIPRNFVAFFAYQALAGPLLLYWLLTRGRWAVAVVAVLLGLGAAIAAVGPARISLHAVGGALALCAIVAMVDLVRQVRHSAPLVLWLLSGLVALPYVFMAAKYLLPGIPAAALLIVLHAARTHQQRYPLTIAVLVAAGWIVSAFVIVGDATLAGSQRAAVEREVPRILRGGGTVWAGGSWAFDEYARRAGAQPLANQPPFPKPGDFVLISTKEYNGRFETLPIGREFLYAISDRRCGVFVLNRDMHAGYFCNRFGYLPFTVGCGELNRFEMYRVVDTLKN